MPSRNRAFNENRFHEYERSNQREPPIESQREPIGNHRDVDERSYSRRAEEPDWHPPRYDHHTIRGLIKPSQIYSISYKCRNRKTKPKFDATKSEY